MWNSFPDVLLDELRCSFCNEFLSQFPIVSYSQDDLVKTVCGRCPIITQENPVRNKSFEIVAQYIPFPCRYSQFGCMIRAGPNQLQNHEQSCKYKQIFCPCLPLGSCPWKGLITELYQHYSEHHDQLTLSLLSEPYYLLTANQTNNFIIQKFGRIFLIHVRGVEGRHVCCSVVCLGPPVEGVQYYYDIQLVSAEWGDINDLFLKRPIQCKEDLEAAGGCTPQISFEKLGQTPVVYYYFSFIQEHDIVNIEKQKSLCHSLPSVKVNHSTDNILRELECPVCNEYMVSSIFLCTAGHSICEKCKKKLHCCPTCRNPLENLRNYTLERVVQLMEFQCKNRLRGCSYSADYSVIQDHEAVCKFAPIKCPLSGAEICDWKGGIGDILPHCYEQHEEYVLEVPNINVTFFKNYLTHPDQDWFVFLEHDNIFKVIYKCENDHFFWNVQHIGDPDLTANFMYEIDIIDDRDFNQRVYFRKPCEMYSEHDAIWAQNYIKLPFVTIEKLIGTNLNYKCNIIKKL